MFLKGTGSRNFLPSSCETPVGTTHSYRTQNTSAPCSICWMLLYTWVRKAHFTCIHNWSSRCCRWKTDALLCSARGGKKKGKTFPLGRALMWEEMDCHLSQMHRYGCLCFQTDTRRSEGSEEGLETSRSSSRTIKIQVCTGGFPLSLSSRGRGDKKLANTVFRCRIFFYFMACR